MGGGVATTPPMCVLGWENSMCGRGLISCAEHSVSRSAVAAIRFIARSLTLAGQYHALDSSHQLVYCICVCRCTRASLRLVPWAEQAQAKNFLITTYVDGTLCEKALIYGMLNQDYMHDENMKYPQQGLHLEATAHLIREKIEHSISLSTGISTPPYLTGGRGPVYHCAGE